MTTDSHVLLLWGDTQVGKTTLLTTAFYNPTIGEIDREESAQSISTLFQGLRDLSNQRLTKPTVVFHYDVELKMKSGKHVKVRDIKGGITRTVDEESVRERLEGVSVVLFLVQWDAGLNQINAIRGAWDHLENAHKGLVITKCEMALGKDDRAWDCYDGWWRQYDWLRKHDDLVGRFGAAVWPTSSYGFDNNTGYPAAILGEFGHSLPFNINPRNVHLPFEWAFSKMEGG
ncbi:MAG TPA: hypothetical protein PLC97_05390 [Myxococcota bacterium]|nr:MAG: hypothetical protein BWX66_00174 [Deltaproteobacteria bacterium ADurb.Bin058]HHW96202.1 hypothetical protein [Oligoflexales bacterium]HQC44640.1 hypothetical protein [Myxococcota bacterium]HQL56830.1 hypothetical protein [Myxococcota bacterium]